MSLPPSWVAGRALPLIIQADARDAFSGMLDAGSGPKIIELDEPSIGVHGFLSSVENQRLDQLWMEQDLFARAVSVLSFMARFGCDAVLEIALASLKRRVQIGKWPRFLLFLVGAILRCPTLCEEAVTPSPEYVPDATWGTFATALRPPLACGGLGACTLDFRGHIKQTLDALPTEYLCALAAWDAATHMLATRLPESVKFGDYLDMFLGKPTVVGYTQRRAYKSSQAMQRQMPIKPRKHNGTHENISPRQHRLPRNTPASGQSDSATASAGPSLDPRLSRRLALAKHSKNARQQVVEPVVLLKVSVVNGPCPHHSNTCDSYKPSACPVQRAAGAAVQCAGPHCTHQAPKQPNNHVALPFDSQATHPATQYDVQPASQQTTQQLAGQPAKQPTQQPSKGFVKRAMDRSKRQLSKLIAKMSFTPRVKHSHEAAVNHSLEQSDQTTKQTSEQPQTSLPPRSPPPRAEAPLVALPRSPPSPVLDPSAGLSECKNHRKRT